jgi:hypothetical protein
MAAEPPATQQAESITVHPGDIVQITDKGHAWHGTTSIVEATHNWGIHIQMLFPNLHKPGTMINAQERLKPGQFAVCGTAAILPPEILARRRDSLETARLLAEEAGTLAVPSGS